MQGNALQYRLPTSEAVYLSANSTVPQTSVGQYHVTQLSKVDDINHFKHTCYIQTHESLRMAQVHNTNYVFTYKE
jgi:hypothetical protein